MGAFLSGELDTALDSARVAHAETFDRHLAEWLVAQARASLVDGEHDNNVNVNAVDSAGTVAMILTLC